MDVESLFCEGSDRVLHEKGGDNHTKPPEI